MSPVSLARHGRQRRTGLLCTLLAAGLLGTALLPAAQAEEDGRDLILREQALYVRQELLNQALKRVERLAGFYRTGLGEDFGRQLRAQAQNLLASEKQKEANKLDTADRKLTEIGRSGEQLARELANAEARLLKHQQAIEAATKKGDKATTQARMQVKYMRGEMTSLANRVRTMAKLLGKTIVPPSEVGPKLTAGLRADVAGHAVAAGKKATAMADMVGEGKPAEAVAESKSARQELEKLAAATRRAHAALEVYRAAEAAEAFAEATSTAADSLRQFATTATAFLKAPDPDLAPEIIRALQNTTHRSAVSLQEARQFHVALVRSVTALKETPKTLVKALPHALKALDDLQKGRELVGGGDPGKAAEKLTAAAAELRQVARELHEARTRLGLEGEKLAAALAQEADALLRGKLPAQIQEQFVRMHVDKVLPAVLQKVRTAAEKALPSTTAAVREIHEGTMMEVEKLFGPDLLARVKLTAAFGAGVAEQPLLAATAGVKGQALAQSTVLLAATEKALRQTINSRFTTQARSGANLLTFTAPVLKNVPR